MVTTAGYLGLKLKVEDFLVLTLSDGRTERQTDGRMDGWMDALTIVFYFTETSLLTFHYIFLAFGILTIVLAITTLVKLSNVSLMKPCTL